jgi:hypothetical protein
VKKCTGAALASWREGGGGSWGAVLVGGAQGLYRGRGVVDGEGGGKASIKDC